jgi:uncharacterized Rossmann fold enzyme
MSVDKLDVFYYPLADGGFPDWAIRKAKIFFPDLIDDVIINDHILYRYIEPLQKMKKKSILVVGGGPSTNLLSTGDFLSYDFIFSMNHFFKHKILRDILVDIICIGAEVNLVDQEFQHYLSKFKPIIAFELHPDWFRLRSALPIFYLKDRKIFYHTKFYGQIGVGARLVTLAAALGASAVSFIGFDGPEAILRGDHAFEKGKNTLPSMCNSDNAHTVHERHYDAFWRYITALYPDTSFISIDKENEYHKYVS